MYPHLMVRPIIDSRLIPHLKGSEGFRPMAEVTFHPSRQAKRAFQRELDKAKERAELEYRLSAEPFLVGSFPPYSAGSTKTFNLVGALPPGQEVRELQVITYGTVKVNAGTGQISAADANVIMAALYSKLRASFYANNDCFNLTPAEVRTINFITDARDSFRQDPNGRLGTPLTTTAINFSIKMKIPFTVRNLEVPEIFSPTSDQLNLPGSKVDIDTNGAALTTVGLASGAGTLTVTDVRLYAVMNQVPVLHFGPGWVWKSRAISQSIDTEGGQQVDIFVGTEEASTGAGAGARVAQFTVIRDGRSQPLNIDPVTLATQFNESQFTVDALSALDITTGTIPFGGVATAAQPVPEGAIGTQAGAQVVPLEWNDGKVRAGAWQWPFWLSSRRIQQNLAAGQSAAITVLYVGIRPVYEASGQGVQLAAANGMAISNIDQLAVRGGNDSEVNKMFKGRFLRMRTQAKAA